MVAGGESVRPLLFLDVDGPLIPFGGKAPGHSGTLERTGTEGNPLLARLDPSVGPQLAALGFELVWATTWAEDANQCIAPLLGLPPLPVLPWPESYELEELDARAGRHWKTRSVVAWAAGRAFAWVDDELTRADRDWVAAHHRGAALLQEVDPRVGLGPADFTALAEWAARLP